MDAVDHALATVGHWLALLLAFVLAIFTAIENAFRALMDQLHIAAGLQTVILLLLTVVLIVAALRVFGGIFRLLILVFLALLLIHVLMAGGLHA